MVVAGIAGLGLASLDPFLLSLAYLFLIKEVIFILLDDLPESRNELPNELPNLK